MIDADPPKRRQRRFHRWSDQATWAIVAVLVVLAVILALAADGGGPIAR